MIAAVQWAAPASHAQIRGWQAMLDRIAERTYEGPSDLRLVWVPGYLHQPIERWVIYQTSPFWRAPAPVIEDLTGPDPSLFLRYDAQGKMRRSRRFWIDRFQWRLFRDTNRFGLPLWIVQGKKGGHKKEFDDIESRISQLNGGSAQPPKAGELPYAVLDERVIEKIRELDLMSKMKDCVRFMDRSPEQLDAEEADKVLEMRKRIWGWLDTQVDKIMDPAEGDGFTRPMIRHMRDNANRNKREPDYDLIEHEFIHEPM